MNITQATNSVADMATPGRSLPQKNLVNIFFSGNGNTRKRKNKKWERRGGRWEEWKGMGEYWPFIDGTLEVFGLGELKIAE